MALRKWKCEIIIDDNDEDLPAGFDFPPRRAAENAIQCHGYPVLLNSSGWGQEISDEELLTIKQW